MTTSAHGNPCNVCKHRWDDPQGHCYMWKAEPDPCGRPWFKLDEWAFTQDMYRQMLGHTQAVTEVRDE